MRPIHIGNVDAKYQQLVNQKAREICRLRTDLHLYQLEAVYKKNSSKENEKIFRSAKEKFKAESAKVYKRASNPLKERIGNYCCYCERKFPIGLAVEHKCPKDNKENWNLILNWDNFLIACATCNGKKGTAPIKKDNIDLYLFPDKDDTFHCFAYKEENQYIGSLNEDLICDPITRERAKKTIDLLKLDEREDINDSATRCYERREKANTAEDWALTIRQKGICDLYLNLIKSGVREGCWSIWMNKLGNIPILKETLLYALPNTAIEYFIDDYWKYEKYFNEQHLQAEYYVELLYVINTRICYIQSHKGKMSDIQIDGVKQWTRVFVDEACKKIAFSEGQMQCIYNNIKALDAIAKP